MKMVDVFSLTVLLGIVSSTLSQIETNSVADPPVTFDHVTTGSPSVESLVDSRFKLLAASFQDQIDDLKGKFVLLETSKTTNNIGENMKTQHQHEIQKRQTKTSDSKRPVCENSSSFCTFFHPDHPDASRKKNTSYSPTVVTNGIGLLQEQPPTKVLKGMPTSCKDLQLLGHKLNGFYLIKTSKNNIETKMETVYCDFQLQTSLNGKDGWETRIGIVDVKSSLVQFDIQGVALYQAYGGNKIRFNRESINVGNGFNWRNELFQAPYPGTYFFSISGSKAWGTSEERTCIAVKLNGNMIGEVMSSDFTSYGGYSYQFTRKLNATDKIELFMKFGGIPYSIYFTGWMLDESLNI